MKYLALFSFFFSLSLAQYGAGEFGPYAALGPTTNEILYMETVFVPGDTPKTPGDQLQLWAGIADQATTTSDRINTIFLSTKNNAVLCGAPKGWWCMQPTVSPQSIMAIPQSDRPVPVPPYAQVRVVYRQDDYSDAWVQMTSDAESGRQLHHYVNGRGKMKGYVTSISISI